MSCEKVSCSASSDLYDCHALHAPEDILNVCRLEDEEQMRRIVDKEGENHKRVLALNLSELFGESLRATWFQRGSSFVLSLLGSVRTAVSHTASDLTTTVSNKAGDLGHKAALRISSAAEDVGVKAQVAAHDVSNTISNKAGEVGWKAQEKASQLTGAIAHKAGETAQQLSSSVSSQAQAAALNIKEKSLETAHSVSCLAQEKALDLKSKGFETMNDAKCWISGVTNEYTQRLKDAVSSTFVFQKLGSLTGRTNMTFALMEEEAERARRMNSSGEIHAIENALKLASFIKAINGPCSDPYIHHTTRLLEEAERSRRVCEDTSDKAAICNAKAVSDLICQKFSLGEQFATKKAAELKVEHAVEITKPFTAAM